jgi:hypothetical protein
MIHRDFVIFVGAGFVIGALWWNFWVRPHDQMLREVSECMGPDRTETAYNRCAQEFQRTHSDNNQ